MFTEKSRRFEFLYFEITYTFNGGYVDDILKFRSKCSKPTVTLSTLYNTVPLDEQRVRMCPLKRLINPTWPVRDVHVYNECR